MSARSSPSYYASTSTDEKLVSSYLSDHGPSKVMSSGVQWRTVQAEGSTFKGKENAIISGVGDFDELTGLKVVIPNNLEEEISKIKGTMYKNPKIKRRIRRILNNRQAFEMDEGWATGTLCGCFHGRFQCKNMVKCQNGHEFCFECIRRQVQEIIYGGLRAHGSLSCTDIARCNESIRSSKSRRALTKDALEKYEDIAGSQRYCRSQP